MKESQILINRFVILGLFMISPVLGMIKFPAKLSIVSIAFILVFVYYSRFKGMKTIIRSSPMFIWLLLTIYHWVNAMYQNVPGVDFIDLLHGFKIYACIAIFAFLGKGDFTGTIKNLVICFSCYLAFSFVVNDVSSSDLDGRMTGVIYSTGLGQTAALTGFYVAFYSLRNRLSLVKTIALYSLPIIVILFTQSRNSLAMLLICVFGHILAYSYREKISIGKTLVTLVISAVFSLLLLNIVLSNTSLGERLADTEKAEQMNENNNRLTNTIFDKIAGDRLVYYVNGWEYFLESPINGIGMWNYRNVSQSLYPLHSEYMVHVCEGGIIGITLWLMFIALAFRSINRSKQDTYIKVVAYASMIAILFCGIYARVFFYEFFFPAIGLVLSMEYWRKPIENIKPLKSKIINQSGHV